MKKRLTAAILATRPGGTLTPPGFPGCCRWLGFDGLCCCWMEWGTLAGSLMSVGLTEFEHEWVVVLVVMDEDEAADDEVGEEDGE